MTSAFFAAVFWLGFILVFLGWSGIAGTLEPPFPGEDVLHFAEALIVIHVVGALVTYYVGHRALYPEQDVDNLRAPTTETSDSISP